MILGWIGFLYFNCLWWFRIIWCNIVIFFFVLLILSFVSIFVNFLLISEIWLIRLFWIVYFVLLGFDNLMILVKLCSIILVNIKFLLSFR